MQRPRIAAPIRYRLARLKGSEADKVHQTWHECGTDMRLPPRPASCR